LTIRTSSWPRIGFVAERDSLALHTVRGDMADLSAFQAESFDLVFHPVSNVFGWQHRSGSAEGYFDLQTKRIPKGSRK
jgi:hypothetical protein